MTIYLDNATTTRPSMKALSAMYPYYLEKWGLPSQPHMRPMLDESVQSIAKLCCAEPDDQFVFTSSGAEAINQVFLSTFLSESLPSGKNHFITTEAEEAAILMSAERLEKLGGVVKMLPLNPQGLIDIKMLREAVTPRTALISLSLVNGLTGVIQPIDEIVSLCQERGILLHLDVTHLLGKSFFESLHADFITFNGDHFHAPVGTGGLIVRDGVKVFPLIAGGLEQGGLRGGGVSIPAMIALGKAAYEAEETKELLCTEVARLRAQLEMAIVAACSDARPLFTEVERVPHISCIAFSDIANEALLFSLNRRGVIASIGGGGCQQIALVLKACQVDDQLSHSALSFALSRETTEDEIERAAQIVAEEVKRLRNLKVGIS